MEKGGTPKSRLTRSAAKQVNNTPSKKINEEEMLHQSIDEDTQNNTSRKSKRKADSKLKTNGDTSTNVNNKKMSNYDSVSESNSIDGCESEDSNISAKQRNSPKPSNHKTPSPKISRKSLRVRRSITPGPELESSASKKMKRCVSEGKLESAFTPTRRGGRAKSESKDFVFTPSKCKSNGKEVMGSISESNSKHIHRNSTLRVIDKIVEANEEESSQEESKKQSHMKESPISPIGENMFNDSETSLEPNKTEEKPSISSPKPASTELEGETDAAKIHSQNNDCEINEEKIQSPPTSPLVSNDPSCRNPQEITDQPTEPISEIANVPLSCDDNNLSFSEDKIQCEDETSTSYNSKVKQPSPNEPNEAITLDPEKQLQGDCDAPLTETAKPTDNESECMTVPPVGDSQSSVSQKNDTIGEKTEEFSSDSQSDNVLISENNNITSISEGIENTPAVKYKDIASNSEEIDIVPQSDEVCKDKNTSSISEVKESTSTPILDDKEVTISDSKEVDNVPQIDEVCKDNDNSDEVEPVVLSESNSPESMELLEIEQRKEDPEEIITPAEEDLNTRGEKSCEIEDDFEQTAEIPAASCEQRGDNLDEVVIEDSENSQGIDETPTSYLNTGTKIEDVEASQIQADPSVLIEHANPIVIEYNMPTDTEVATEDPLEQETSVLIQEASKLELVDEYGREQVYENNENVIVLKVQDDKLPGEESTLRLDQQREFELEGDFNQDDYDRENKVDDSGSNSDIYKDMSDFGTDGDEKKGGSNFDVSMSSGSGSGDSDEDASSGDYEEGEEEGDEVEENEGKKNIPSDIIAGDSKKGDQESDSKVGEKLFDSSTPMTYDKALAILNKDRVKKIDDEEFFDMFTQELNRVSEESGSDSDIAIVDEYIMEPEETTKKPNQKTSNPPSSQANAKPAQRPPVSTNQPVPSLQHFPVNYNQQRPPQHIHPGMQRMNLPQNELYNHYGNQAMPHVNAIRGPAMYNQFGPHPSGMPDPRMYNPHDDNFAGAGMYNHPGHVPDAQLHYPNAPGLKVRNVNNLNSQSFTHAMNQNYACPEQMTQDLGLEMSSFREQDDMNMETMNETVNKLEQDSSQDRVYKTGQTPILDLLGLDNEKLKLLKKVLGLKTKPEKVVSKTASDKKNKFLRKKMAFEKKKPHTAVTKSQKRELKKSLLKKFLSDSTFNFFRESNSSEHSSEESASSEHVFPSSSRDSLEKQDSIESSSDSSFDDDDKNREVSIEDDSVSVTVFTKKPRHRQLKNKAVFKQWTAQKSSPGTSSFKKKRKRQRAKKKSDSNSSSENLEYEMNLKRQKTTQGKKQNKKEPTVIKSNCGTFTVDPLTATSQSESEALSHEEQSSGPSKYLEQLKRNMKKEQASGKNKLSNMFSQHSFQHSRTGSKRKAADAFVESEKKAAKEKVKKLKKLPSEILEQLSNEAGKKKSHQPSDSGSEVEIAKTRKKRWPKKMKAKKMKIKSSVANQDYIPIVTGGATQFGLSRLDKNLLTPAELAAKFRSERLYGSTVKRITIMDFKG